eukprot:1480532-Prymnesium_polylepis.1
MATDGLALGLKFKERCIRIRVAQRVLTRHGSDRRAPRPAGCRASPPSRRCAQLWQGRVH